MNTITEIQNLLDLCKEQAAKIEQVNKDHAAEIEQLKKHIGKLFDESIQSVGAVLNETEKPSLYASTARTKTFDINQDIAEHLRELGKMTSDFYKTGAYDTAADIIDNLSYEVQNGESLLNISGIGKGIANKIDLFLDEYFEDEESANSCDGQILGESESESESDSDSDCDSTCDPDFRVLYNTTLAGVFDELASYEPNPHKSATYLAAATTIFHLPFKVKSGEELAKGPKKVVGIGKGIARKIDEFLETGAISKLEELKYETPDNYKLTRAFDKLASREDDLYKKNAYRNAADAIFDLSFTVTSGEELSKGPKKVAGIGKSIARKIDEFLKNGKFSKPKKVVFSTNVEIAWHLEELASLEGEEFGSQDAYKIEAYRKAAKAIRALDFEVTNGSEISQGPNKIPGIGKGIAKKIDELLVTGQIERIEELSSA